VNVAGAAQPQTYDPVTTQARGIQREGQSLERQGNNNVNSGNPTKPLVSPRGQAPAAAQGAKPLQHQANNFFNNEGSN